MKQYRKKPVVIHATQVVDNNFKCLIDIPISESKNWSIGADDLGFYIQIPTLEGDMKARNNDWIIKGINGELYPIKNEIFLKTYEIVND